MVTKKINKYKYWDYQYSCSILIEYLYSIGKRCSHTTLCKITDEYLFKLVCPEHNEYPFIQNVIDNAISNEYVELLVYLCSDDKYFTIVMDLAASIGHLKIVEYLHIKGKDCTTNAMDNAASNGHLEVVVYLHDIGKSFTSKAITNAETNGHKDVVKYLRSINQI